MLSIQIKCLDERIRSNLPKYATPGSAGLDLYACIDQTLVLAPGQSQKVPTGLSVYLGDSRYAGLILPRSGWGSKGLILANTVGLIDSDYQGPLLLALWNRGDHILQIQPMDAVAQLMVIPVQHINFDLVNDFSEISQRGDGGFGSTDQIP